MIAGFEVGAALTLATAKFDSSMLKSMDLVRKMTEQMERLRTVATGIFSETGVTGLNRRLLTTERRLGAVTAETRNLTRAMDALALSSAAVAGAMPRGGGGGGSGGGAGFAAGWGVGKFANKTGAGAAVALATGAVLEANLESFIIRSLTANNVDIVGDPMQMPEGRVLLDIVKREAKRTGFGPGEIANASTKVLLGLTGRSFDEKLSILPTILEGAAYESRIKGTSFESNAEGVVGISHMLQAYSPEQIAKVLPAYMAMGMASPKSVAQFNRALSYGIGTGLSAGVDPAVLLAMNAAGQQLGLGTKSGTWADDFMKSLMPTVAGLTAHQQKRHLAGMKVLGLIAPDGKSAAWDYTNNQLDPLKAFEILKASRDKMPRDVFSAAVQNAFLTTGSREGNQFSMGPSLDNLIGLVKVAHAQLGADKGLEVLNQNDPVQQFKSSLASTEVSLARLGTTTLHTLNPAFEKLANLLEAITSTKTGTDIASIATMGGAGLWLANKLGLLKPGARLAGVAGGALGGALSSTAMSLGAEVTIASIATMAVPITMAILIGGGIGAGIGTLIKMAADYAINKLSGGKYQDLGDFGPRANPILETKLPKPGQETMHYDKKQHKLVHIQNLNVYGWPGQSKQELLNDFTNAVRNTVSGSGSRQSAYQTGATR